MQTTVFAASLGLKVNEIPAFIKSAPASLGMRVPAPDMGEGWIGFEKNGENQRKLKTFKEALQFDSILGLVDSLSSSAPIFTE